MARKGGQAVISETGSNPQNGYEIYKYIPHCMMFLEFPMKPSGGWKNFGQQKYQNDSRPAMIPPTSIHKMILIPDVLDVPEN